MQTRNEPGMLGKFFTLVFGAVVLVLGLMFSMIVLAVVAVIALAAFGYFWWKTRALRKAMREHPPGGESPGQVIDGEAIVVEEYRMREGTVLPREPLEK
ncbi:MAG: hypothetical protein Q7U97_09190 [Rhodocyclaceae bacterium]|nr:hypothetical protein [Rhodocyclaceae bacterium]